MNEKHPALIAARSSWRCVHAKDREGWLALMADDVVIEDPIGVGPTNPTGAGIRGKAAVGAFWDANIAPSQIRIEAHESFVAGDESAHVLTLTTRFPNDAVTPRFWFCSPPGWHSPGGLAQPVPASKCQTSVPVSASSAYSVCSEATNTRRTPPTSATVAEPLFGKVPPGRSGVTKRHTSRPSCTRTA